MKYVWKKLPHRTNTPCTIITKGRMNSILVEFEDGHQMITSRYAVRRIYD